MSAASAPLILRAFLLTCPARREMCARTLTEWARSDWGEFPCVFRNPGLLDPPYLRGIAGMRVQLGIALRSEGTHFLLLEDDLLIARHLRHNLETWPPLRRPEFTLGSLYNPGVERLSENPAERSFIADPHRVLGAQALLVSRSCAEHLVAHWEDLPFHTDIRIALLAAPLGPIHFHIPSLVQHVGEKSTWGGPPHRALDYDPAFRA